MTESIQKQCIVSRK